MIDVTAIIPTRNSGTLLGRSIGSALAQAPAFKKILVVDDAGRDDAGALVEAFRRPDVLSYVRLDSRRGPGGARNAGLELSTTQFIQFIDSDDALLPGATRAFWDELKREPRLDLYCFAGAAQAAPPLVLADDAYSRPFDRQFEAGVDALDCLLRRGRHLASPCLYVFRRLVAEAPPRIRFPEMLHEDEVFTPELFSRCKATVVTRKALYLRDLRPDSITTSPPTPERLAGRLRAYAYWRGLASAHGLVRWLPRRLYANRLLVAARRDALRLDPAIARDVFRQLGR